MTNNSTKIIEQNFEKKFATRNKRKRKKMKVSGKSIFNLKKIITKKRGA